MYQDQMETDGAMMDDAAATEEQNSSSGADSLGAMMLDMAAAVDPGITNFIYRWLLALNEAFPEQTATWTLLHQDMEAVAQYCVLHYCAPEACLAQQPDALGALIVTQENNEFLPGLSAHDLFNHHNVSRATRQSMVSYTQCMYTLVGQWTGESLAAEYEAAAAQHAEHQHAEQQQQQQQWSGGANVHPTQRYAGLFDYMLDRSARHQNVDTGVPAINAFFATATGQWVTVLLVRHLCLVHTDVLCELFQFVESNFHVAIADPAIWTPALLPILARKLAGITASPTRRAEVWGWFERWMKWFDEGSPVAFVTREQYQRAGGRGILYPETLTSDVRAVLVSDTAAEALARMQLRRDEVVQLFDRVVEARARGDDESVIAIITQFMEIPSVRSAAQRCMREWGVPPDMLAAFGFPAHGGEGGGHGQHGSSSTGAAGGGREAQRAATLARCRQRAAQTAMAAGTLASASSLAPPVMDTRSIDDLVAFIGAAPESSAAPNKKNKNQKSSAANKKRR